MPDSLKKRAERVSTTPGSGYQKLAITSDNLGKKILIGFRFVCIPIGAA